MAERNRSITDLDASELKVLIGGARALLNSKDRNNDPNTEVFNKIDLKEFLEYTGPKRTAKRKKNEEPQSVIETKNRYETLTIEEPSNQTTENMEEDTNQEKKQNKIKIPPIIIKNTQKWTYVSKIIKTQNINFVKCKLINTGILINLTTEQDYKKLAHCLNNEKIEYYTHDSISERRLKIVIRGIPKEVTEQEVQEELLELGYPIHKIVRMKNKQQMPIPLVIVEIKKEYKSIFDLKHCCNLKIQVEPLRKRTGIIQCHKCQMFGHIQKNCFIQYKCMKCGEGHSTHECTKPKTTPPKCANCDGEHLSTHIKCPQNPNNPINKKPPQEPSYNTENVWFKNKKNNTEPTKSNNNTDLAKTIGEMLILFSNTNATMEQKIEFITKTDTLIKLFNDK